MASLFYHNILDYFLLFAGWFALRIADFLAKCNFNLYVASLMVFTICILIWQVQVIFMPVNKSYSFLWLKTDWDMPNLLYCIHSGDLPQKLLDTSVKKKYWKQLDPVFVMSLPA